ncbi:hypothetical protein GCM10022394_11230 [Zobellella aerophila]|uniref:Uncharacterized protein n=1 Tax=Zobellella aerophila TaxID=870480 RepID=A0ABP6VET3_9GAMM
MTGHFVDYAGSVFAYGGHHKMMGHQAVRKMLVNKPAMVAQIAMGSSGSLVFQGGDHYHTGS